MIVYVLGQRCGTSSLCKRLVELGYPVVGPLDMRAYESNPDGHYENIAARRLNDQILDQFNTDVFRGVLCPPMVCPSIQGFLSSYQGHIILKDPRFAYTWPIWKASAGDDCAVIWCRRDAGEQVQSMMRCYGLEWNSATANVKHYEVCAEAATREIDPSIEVWLHDKNREVVVTEALDGILS